MPGSARLVTATVSMVEPPGGTGSELAPDGPGLAPGPDEVDPGVGERVRSASRAPP